jgi:hypothetical protein
MARCVVAGAVLVMVVSAAVWTSPARAEDVRYSGPYADSVRRLLSNVGPWSCPESVRSQTGTVPPDVKADACTRDGYVKAAVLNAWAAECYARTERDVQAREKAGAMMAELQKARALCSNAPTFGGVGTCDTLRIYACPAPTSAPTYDRPSPETPRPPAPSREDRCRQPGMERCASCGGAGAC